jgi:response regulator RpfG family c-di-GMP phosphodiesterase
MNDKPAVLLVDDEIEITRALTRIFRRHYEVSCCNEPAKALQMVQDNHYAVIISDMRMPKMDGASLLAKVKQLRPNMVRLLLTGHSDMQSTIRAINDGQIFSYVSKPWNNQQLLLTLQRAVEHFQLNRQLGNLNRQLANQNELLQQTNESLEQQVSKRTSELQQSNQRLLQSAKKQRSLFQNLLDMINAIIVDRVSSESGHNKRVAFQCRLLAESQNLDRVECTRIYLAALMADLGKVTISDDLIGKSEQQLDSAQYHTYQQHVLKGAQLLGTLHNLEPVATIIKHQHEHYSGGGFPERLKKQAIPIGSRILLIAKDYDRLLLGLKHSKKLTPAQARAHLTEHSANVYDPQLVDAFLALLKDLPNLDTNGFDYAVTSNRLQVGTILAQDVLYNNGTLLLPKETVISEQLLQKIKHHEDNHGQRFTFFIY